MITATIKFLNNGALVSLQYPAGEGELPGLDEYVFSDSTRFAVFISTLWGENDRRKALAEQQATEALDNPADAE